MDPAALDLVEDIGDAMAVEEEMRDANTPQSTRRRTIGGLDVSVSSNLVSVCAVYCAVWGLELDPVMAEAGRQCERYSTSRFEVYHRVLRVKSRGSVSEPDGSTSTS